MSSWLTRLQSGANATFRSAGIPVSRWREERPCTISGYSRNIRIFRAKLWYLHFTEPRFINEKKRLYQSGRMLEFTCTRDELQDPRVLRWLAEVYLARTHGVQVPDPPVPVTQHWQVYGSDKCHFLWTLRALDLYRLAHPDALVEYDPRMEGSK